MRFKKVYGQSKTDVCPFCQRQATTTSSQGIPVCQEHKVAILNEFKCICGDWLELQTGKYGTYFKCHQCGNINFKKTLEINVVKNISNPDMEKKVVKKNKPFKDYSIKKQEQDKIKKDNHINYEDKEEIVMPGDPRYFD